ncbi:MAG: hypothetical protein NTV43_02015 [Methylococcales bacterium]|nr:hypothetical protein [Methylococcales bacterium]
MNDILTWAGVLVGIIGLAYAVYEGYQRKKLGTHIRAHNWLIYQRINNATGYAQRALAEYKRVIPQNTNTNTDLLELMIRSDESNQEVLREIIRQIQEFEPSFSETDFEHWMKEGKLTEDKVKLFRQFSVSTGFAKP